MADNSVQRLSGFPIRHRGDEGALFGDTSSYNHCSILHRLYPGGVQDNITIDFGNNSLFGVGCSHKYIYCQNMEGLAVISVDDGRISTLCATTSAVFRIDPAYDNETAMVVYRYVADSFIVDTHSGRNIRNVDCEDMRDTLPMCRNTWLICVGNDLHVLDTRSKSKTFLTKRDVQTRISTYYESLNALSVKRDGDGASELPFEYGIMDVRNLAEYTLTTCRCSLQLYMMF